MKYLSLERAQPRAWAGDKFELWQSRSLLNYSKQGANENSQSSNTVFFSFSLNKSLVPPTISPLSIFRRFYFLWQATACSNQLPWISLECQQALVPLKELLYLESTDRWSASDVMTLHPHVQYIHNSRNRQQLCQRYTYIYIHTYVNWY